MDVPSPPQQEGGQPLSRLSRNMRRMMQRAGGGAVDEPGRAGLQHHDDADGDEPAQPVSAGGPRRRVLGALKSRMRLGGRKEAGAAADGLPPASSFDYEAGMGFPRVCGRLCRSCLPAADSKARGLHARYLRSHACLHARQALPQAVLLPFPLTVPMYGPRANKDACRLPV